MLQTISQNLHSKEDIPEAINTSCHLLMSTVKSIQEDAKSGYYFGVRGKLDLAVRELQYLDRMITESYGHESKHYPSPSLHERATPGGNYLLSPEFHKKREQTPLP